MNKPILISSVAGFALGAGVCYFLIAPSKNGDPSPASGGLGEGDPARGAEASAAPAGLRAPGAPRPADRAEAGHHDWEALLAEPVATEAEIEAHLEKHKRSRDALVAAGLLANNHDLLREAAGRFPDDPMVLFLAVGNDLFPEQRREWVERFKASQPDNGLAAYFMAGEHFRANEPEAAIAELRRGAALGTFDDFSAEGMLATEAMMLELGRSPLHAKLRATFGQELPHLQQLRDVMHQLESVQGQAASREQANALAALGAAVGNDFSQGPGSRLLIHQAVGLSIESKFLQQLDASFESPYFQGSPATMLAEIEADRARIRRLAESAGDLKQLNESMMMHFLERTRTLGESAAIEWLREWRDAQ